MDWYPLYNSVRIALLSTVIIFFAGIAAAYYVARLPRAVKGVLDAVFTLPLVLPPTVVGYLLLRVLGPRRAVGAWVLAHLGRQADHDLVFRHLRDGGRDLSADVPHGARRVREL